MGDGAYPEWQPLDFIAEAKLMQRKFSKDEENPGATREGLLHGRASKLSREATKPVVEDAWGSSGEAAAGVRPSTNMVIDAGCATRWNTFS